MPHAPVHNGQSNSQPIVSSTVRDPITFSDGGRIVPNRTGGPSGSQNLNSVKNSLKLDENQDSLASDKDYEIEEIHLDYHTMKSLDRVSVKGDTQKETTGQRNQFSSTNDIIEFSSIRDAKDHEIFTSSHRIKLGKIRMDNGAIFEGEWFHGYRDGEGTMTWPNGCVYVGSWENGCAQGRGKLLFERGEYYEGNFFQDKADGYGEYYFKDGSVYKGQWKGDKQHGEGVETWADGTTYSGNFVQGHKHGIGKMNFPLKGKFEGEFRLGIIHGRGTFYFKTGQIYFGEWKEGKFDGIGELQFPNGKVYNGSFKRGKRSGMGILKWADGRKYEGLWKDDLQDGQGEFIFTTGNKKRGIWAKGNLSRWMSDEELSRVPSLTEKVKPLKLNLYKTGELSDQDLESNNNSPHK